MPTPEPVIENTKGDLAIEEKLDGQELAQVPQDISRCQKEIMLSLTMNDKRMDIYRI